MNHTSTINLRSHHSLKNSAIYDPSVSQHMNPLSSRAGLSKKLSLNSKCDTTCATTAIRGQFLVDSSQEMKDIRTGYMLNTIHNKNQMFIPLGHKGRDNGFVQPNQIVSTDAQQKIDYMLYELEKQGNRLAMIESKILNSTIKEDQSVTSNNWNTNCSSLQASQSYEIRNEITNLRLQLSKVLEHHQSSSIIQSFQFRLKEQISVIKSIIQSSTQNMRAFLQKKVNTQIFKLNNELQRKFSTFQDNISEYIQSLNTKDDFYSIGPFAQKIVPMFKNPSFRLKFVGKVSIIEKSNQKNPEVQSDFKQFQLESHEQTYLVDKDGYLLDESQRYLLNRRGECVQLTNEQINILLSISLKGMCQ